MRKLWCAGAIASGILLLGAAPAQADVLPNPSVLDAPVTALGYALAPTNDWRLSSPVASDPLSGEPLMDLKPGNRQLLQVQPGAQQQGQAVEKPADHRRLLPAADVVSRTLPDAGQNRRRGPLGGLPIQGIPMPLAGQDFKFAGLPFDSIVDGTLFGGLTPAGLPAMAGTGTREPAADERPVAPTRTEAGSPEIPLLGGLGGGNPVGDLQQQLTNLQSDLSGLPVGGRSVRAKPARKAAATPAPTASVAPVDEPAPAVSAAPASATPAPSPSTPRGFAAEVDDPRLHEEPVDGFVGK
ncbi:hypothetical protein [Actinoplanes aureus]|uniref:Secreted protein n=1 Tax=Actinoplanes aureus TaxID=2792083 RepID=A0A931CHY6_9ACTN|nr:hypothetical protein [Actinoplanes aureus]MBG0566786.1 hypothetical protein [Actinoplanes aureus]